MTVADDELAAGLLARLRAGIDARDTAEVAAVMRLANAAGLERDVRILEALDAGLAITAAVPVAEIRRWTPQPGDRVIVRLGQGPLSAATEQLAREKIRAVLALDPAVPILVLGEGDRIAVIGPEVTDESWNEMTGEQRAAWLGP